MLVEEKIMEVLTAYDLTRSFRWSAALCGVDHHTVRRYVAARDAGLDPLRVVAALNPEWVRERRRGYRFNIVRRGPSS